MTMKRNRVHQEMPRENSFLPGSDTALESNPASRLPAIVLLGEFGGRASERDYP